MCKEKVIYYLKKINCVKLIAALDSTAVWASFVFFVIYVSAFTIVLQDQIPAEKIVIWGLTLPALSILCGAAYINKTQGLLVDPITVVEILVSFVSLAILIGIIPYLGYKFYPDDASLANIVHVAVTFVETLVALVIASMSLKTTFLIFKILGEIKSCPSYPK